MSQEHLHQDVPEASPTDWSDATLRDHIAGTRKVQYEQQEVISKHDANQVEVAFLPRVVSISANAVSKRYNAAEMSDVAQAIELAATLDVRVPRILRTVHTEGDEVECVYERVDGQTLIDAWSGLSWYTTIRLAWQLRGMVERMRAVTNPTAGSLGTGICRSFWLEDRPGLPAHTSSMSIAAVINFWINFKSMRHETMKSVDAHQLTCSQPKQSTPLLFTHHDLSPRNLMIDRNSRLWVIDWDLAGWYPDYFEGPAMHNFWIPKTWTWLAKLRWKLFAWIVIGRCEKDKLVLQEVRRKATRFPVARRWNIAAGASVADPSFRTGDW